MFCFPLHNETACTHALTHGEVEGFKSQPRLSVTSKNSRLHSDTDPVCLPLCVFQCLSTVLSLSLSLCSVINTQLSRPWRFWNNRALRAAQLWTTESNSNLSETWIWISGATARKDSPHLNLNLNLDLEGWNQSWISLLRRYDSESDFFTKNVGHIRETHTHQV